MKKLRYFNILLHGFAIYKQSIFKENRYLSPNINLKHNTNQLTKDILIITFLLKILKNNALDKTEARV